MKILRNVLSLVLFLAGIVLASVNATVVPFTYLPPLGVGPRPEGATIELPLWVPVIAAVVFGALIAAAGSGFEHLRLRAGLRKQRRIAERAEGSLEDARGEVEQLRLKLEEAEQAARAAAAAPVAVATDQAGDGDSSGGDGASAIDPDDPFGMRRDD